MATSVSTTYNQSKTVFKIALTVIKIALTVLYTVNVLHPYSHVYLVRQSLNARQAFVHHSVFSIPSSVACYSWNAVLEHCLTTSCHLINSKPLMKAKRKLEEKKEKKPQKIWLSISDSVGRYIMKYLSPIEFALITLASRYYFMCTSGINATLHVGGVLHTPWVTPAVTFLQTHCTPGDKHTPTHACTWTHTHMAQCHIISFPHTGRHALLSR